MWIYMSLCRLFVHDLSMITSFIKSVPVWVSTRHITTQGLLSIIRIVWPDKLEAQSRMFLLHDIDETTPTNGEIVGSRQEVYICYRINLLGSVNN